VETFSRGTLDPWYVTGFADGSGSFTYSRSGRQLAVYFAVKANERELLELLQSHFDGIGRIYDVSRGSYFRVSRRDDLMRVVDHFDRYPLRTRKQQAYKIWRQMVVTKQDFRRPDRDLLESLATQLSALTSGTSVPA